MQACACTPRYENETPESHFLIKDILLSSPTLVPDVGNRGSRQSTGIQAIYGDPEFSVFSLYPLHFLKSKTGFPIANVGNDRFGLFSYR